MKHTALLIAAGTTVTFLLFVAVQVLIVLLNGRPVPVPTIPRDPQIMGHGTQLTYVVMGDSTTIAQGAAYEDGYTLASARHLAERYKVTFVNVGVSGAVAKDVAHNQVSQAIGYKPDIVLIAVGANDVTHLTSGSSVKRSTQSVIDRLRAANPAMRIVVTGAPAMDAVPRFPWPVQRVALQRVRALNSMFKRLSKSDNLIFAPVADQTRAAFRADPTLFAADKFHPNARGYALWTPVINHALDEALN